MIEKKRLQHLQCIREYELQKIINFLPPTGSILEIGAGSGWQARLLQKYGYEVTAIDIPSSRYVDSIAFPVIPYDGFHIPFSNDTFNIIFSSNVLEHIPNLVDFQNEIKRVIRPDGIAIHIVPTSTWRLWTIITHIFYILQLIYSHLKKLFKMKEKKLNYPNSNLKYSYKEVLMRLLWPHRHGERGSTLSELYLFSKSAWRSHFKSCGWTIEICQPVGLFYTGNQIFSSLVNLSTRRILAKFLGSSTIIFLVHPLK